MKKTKHYHAIELDYDVVCETARDYFDFRVTPLELFPETIDSILRVEEGRSSGYLLPIGALHFGQLDNRRFRDCSSVRTAIPAELYKLVLHVQDVVEEYGFRTSISDVLRFMIWANRPYTIAPDGDLLDGVKGWLPPLFSIKGVQSHSPIIELTTSLYQSKFIQTQDRNVNCSRDEETQTFHLESLDSLICRFEDDGWSVKVFNTTVAKGYKFLSIQVLKER